MPFQPEGIDRSEPSEAQKSKADDGRHELNPDRRHRSQLPNTTTSLNRVVLGVLTQVFPAGSTALAAVQFSAC